MKGYLKYFKTVLMSGLQYKEAAIAGIVTQFFWGFLQIFIYEAFYKGATGNIPMSFSNVVSYVWLQQAFLALIFLKQNDSEISKSIKDGTVAYELLRPYDLEKWWFVKNIAKRLAATSLRIVPLLIVAFIVPEPYRFHLPDTLLAGVMFIVTMALGAIIYTNMMVILYGIMFFTYNDKGVNNIFFNLAGIISGATIPVPLLPDVLQKIAYVLPFRLISDLPFRIYSGNIPHSEILVNIVFQLAWILILYLAGKIIFRKATKKVYIQGG